MQYPSNPQEMLSLMLYRKESTGIMEALWWKVKVSNECFTDIQCPWWVADAESPTSSRHTLIWLNLFIFLKTLPPFGPREETFTQAEKNWSMLGSKLMGEQTLRKLEAEGESYQPTNICWILNLSSAMHLWRWRKQVWDREITFKALTVYMLSPNKWKDSEMYFWKYSYETMI